MGMRWQRHAAWALVWLTACGLYQRGPQHPGQWPALDAKFLAEAAESLYFRLGKPEPVAIARDGTILFRRTGPRDRVAALYQLDATGHTTLLADAQRLLQGGSEQLSAAERARRERTRTPTSGIVDVDISRDGRRVLIPLGARVFVVDRDGGKSRELALGSGYPFDPHIAPDGEQVAFVRDSDLWVADVDGRAPLRLTQHTAGAKDGIAEFVAQEEFGRQRGFFWSPDSQSIAFTRTHEDGVDTLYVSDARHPERAPQKFKYPRAGRPNARVELGVVSIDGGQPRWVRWDHGRWPYLARVLWQRHAPLCLLVLDRSQTELALLAVDSASLETRVLLTAQDSAWVNIPSGVPYWLPDGSGFVWMREAAQGWALELRDPNGARLHTLVSGEFGLRALAGVDEAQHDAIVLASPDPRQQHVWRVPLDGSPPSALTAGGGVHRALADHGSIVISSALRSGGSQVRALFADGRSYQLPSVAERPRLVPTTELESVDVEGRRLYTAITRPRRFDPDASYPVLLKVYAGPGVHMVTDALDSYLLDQWYADAGFIVVRADGRGTPDRGRAFERAISGDLISVPLADQVGALQAMARRHPEMDPDRVGVFGWSFGGYFSAMAVLLRPDVFKAAVAGAPVTDWSLYDTAYTERYLRTPSDNPRGYAYCSALTHAASLSRPLLLMHGVTDDNVHFAHTLALVQALFAAGKRAEVVALPSTHMLADPKLAFAREQVQVEFFREHLGP